MSDKSANAFSYAVGGLALISTISSLLLYSSAYLPKAQLRVLDELFAETWGIYHKAEADGLLPQNVATAAQAGLLLYGEECEVLREITYRARSIKDKIRIVFLGHSRKIMRLGDDVEVVRATLVTTSQQEKARRIAQHLREESTAHHDPRPDDAAEPTLIESTEQSLDDPNTPYAKKLTSYLHHITSMIWWTNQKSDGRPSIDMDGDQCPSTQYPGPPDSPSRSATLVNEDFSSPDGQSPGPKNSATPAGYLQLLHLWLKPSFPNSPNGDSSNLNNDIAPLPV